MNASAKPPLIGQSVERKEDERFLTGARPVHRRHHAARPDLRASSCARRTRTRASSSVDTAAATQGARRARHLHRRGLRRQDGRPALRLADQQPRRHADEGAARTRCSPTARCATWATTSRWSWPRRCEQARTPPRRWSTSTTKCCRRWSTSRRRREGAARRCTTRRRTTSATSGRIGDKAGVDAAFARRAHVTKLDLRQQPAGPQRDRAARGQRQLQPRRRRATRCTSPTRTRTSSGC